MKPAIFTLVPLVLLSAVAFANSPWVTVIDRDGADGAHLTVQLNSIVVYEYTVYTAPQFGGIGYVADLEPGDVFIEWDEDPGHGNAHLFSFSGTYTDESPDFLQVTGTGPTNWTVHTVTSSGTLTKTDDCCNELDAIHFYFSPLTLTKTDDVNDCIEPGDEVTYTICYYYPDSPNLPDINDVNIIDYLPEAAEFSSSDPCGIYYSQPRTLIWPLGTIRPGDTNCVTLTVKVKECIADCGVITNLCEIKSGDWVMKNTSKYTPLCVASNPVPRFGGVGTTYIGQSPDINLVWCPGYLAADVNGQDIYFGTNYSNVNEAEPSDLNVYKGQQSTTSYLATGLEAGVTYYWRIDEVNDSNVWRGTVWNFKTGFLIDDFERYTSTANLNNNWLTGYPVCFEGTSAGTGQLTLVSDTANKYMRFTYDKSGGTPEDPRLYFSETTIVYGPNGADWTDSGIFEEKPRLLVISFKGESDNSTHPVYDRMYVAVEDIDGDVNITLHPDPNAQAMTYWQQWSIPLEDLNKPDVNLEAVTSFSIGFGERCRTFNLGGDDGDVMFDDIRLIPPCMPDYYSDADLTYDCKINSYDLVAFAQDWLTCGICGMRADIYPDIPDGIVDFRDFAVLASEWLKEEF